MKKKKRIFRIITAFMLAFAMILSGSMVYNTKKTTQADDSGDEAAVQDPEVALVNHGSNYTEARLEKDNWLEISTDKAGAGLLELKRGGPLDNSSAIELYNSQKKVIAKAYIDGSLKKETRERYEGTLNLEFCASNVSFNIKTPGTYYLRLKLDKAYACSYRYIFVPGATLKGFELASHLSGGTDALYTTSYSALVNQIKKVHDNIYCYGTTCLYISEKPCKQVRFKKVKQTKKTLKFSWSKEKTAQKYKVYILATGATKKAKKVKVHKLYYTKKNSITLKKSLFKVGTGPFKKLHYLTDFAVEVYPVRNGNAGPGEMNAQGGYIIINSNHGKLKIIYLPRDSDLGL